MLSKCPECGAECKEANQLNRFVKRHPAVCRKKKADREFSAQLAQGTRSVTYDEDKFVEGMPVEETC